MSVRLFHRGARLVFVVRRTAAGCERWWSPGRGPHKWGTILQEPLALVGLGPDLDDRSVTCRIGRVAWTQSRHWATIDVEFHGGSVTKRALVATALLKAARYGRPELSGG
jgi:hypothetical protein